MSFFGVACFQTDLCEMFLMFSYSHSYWIWLNSFIQGVSPDARLNHGGRTYPEWSTRTVGGPLCPQKDKFYQFFISNKGQSRTLFLRSQSGLRMGPIPESYRSVAKSSVTEIMSKWTNYFPHMLQKRWVFYIFYCSYRSCCVCVP